MKRVLNRTKQVAVTSIFLGLLFTASSFTFGLVEGAPLAENIPQEKVSGEKVQRVKITVNKDGKETKIDTTFNLPDEKKIKAKVDSILKNLDVEEVGTGKSKYIIHRTGKDVKWNALNGEKFPAEEQFDIMIQNGDSGTAKRQKRVLHIRRNGDLMSIGSSDCDQLIPPPPPIPPHASRVFHQRFGGDPFAADPKDESIVSYEKKDIGKGLEKITIIRKKSIEHRQDQKIQVNVETKNESKNELEGKDANK